MFDDRPVEIAELTYVIKQDLSSLNAQISSLQSLSKSQKLQSTRNSATEQEGEHNKNVRSLKPKWQEIRPHQLTKLPGCRPPPRQTGRRRGQFQRSTRSSNEKHPSFAVTDGELRVVSIFPFPTLSRNAPICLPALQHPDQITDASARLSKLQFRYPEFRPFLVIIFRSYPRAPTVRSATLDDGRSPAHKHLYKHARRSHRHDRKNHKRTWQRIWPTCSHGLGARVRNLPPLSPSNPPPPKENNTLNPSLQQRNGPKNRRQHRRRSRQRRRRPTRIDEILVPRLGQ